MTGQKRDSSAAGDSPSAVSSSASSENVQLGSRGPAGKTQDRLQVTETWQRGDLRTLVTTWLINSMEPAIGKPHMFLPTAKDVWEAVREMYSDNENSSQIFEWKTKLWKAKQGDRNVTVFYNELVTSWQELDLCYENEQECPNDSIRHKKREENDRVYVFLTELNQDLD
ncbi:uncharacterized protein LOC112093751 [Morus notabilis]|uniref:uncharacterized protein LOC112093751 n=1 Tax=Morus notabilis TaxID=981085 RepID=UPI000CED0DE7|nr:uncharacterized protein LOC112093751 [Morus notabilis]